MKAEQVPAETEIGAPAVHIESVGYRIRRVDRYNFELQRWIEPGMKRNGKMSAGKWVPDGYYPRIDQAANAMFDRLMLQGKECPTLEDIRRDVERAREVVCEVAQRL